MLEIAKTSPKRRLEAGFTLVELLIALLLAGVLASLAVPSYRSFAINQQLSAASSDFLVSILQARSEAIRQGKIVAVLPNDGASWTSGWYVSVVNNNCVPTGAASGKTQAVGEFVSLNTAQSTASFVHAAPSFTYAATGFPYTSCASPYYSGSMNGTLAFRTVETARERRIIVSKSGRARICDPAKETCTAD